jgi:hypothetical protein
MKKTTIAMLYKMWAFFATTGKYPKICERLNIWINKLEAK